MNFDGFLGTRASFMLDVVFLAMFAVVPALGWSVWLVKARRNYGLHKLVQLTLGAVLLAAVVLFELEMRLYGWRERAEASPYFGSALNAVLGVHLLFAVTTALLWIYVIVQALRKIPSPPGPSAYSRSHVLWARLAAWDMVATSVTGWAFYWLAFISG